MASLANLHRDAVHCCAAFLRWSEFLQLSHACRSLRSDCVLLRPREERLTVRCDAGLSTLLASELRIHVAQLADTRSGSPPIAPRMKEVGEIMRHLRGLTMHMPIWNAEAAVAHCPAQLQRL